jgi:putative transposase
VGSFDTVEFPKDGDGCRWDSTPHDRLTRVRFQGVGHVRVHQHRAVAGKVKTVSVKREGKRWYVVLTAEQDQPEPLPATGSVAGIDLGIANFLADSHGTFVPNPRHARKAAARLQAAQQALSRCKRGSGRRKKAAAKVANLHRTVRRQRLDHAHKTALALVRAHDVIAHEDLRIRNMSKAPAPRPNGDGTYAPNGAVAKAGLNHGIADAGWGVFLTILHAKAESAGREMIAVDPRNTPPDFVGDTPTRTCPSCGHVAKENRPTQEKFHCLACGHTAHADTVGALNVLRAGAGPSRSPTGLARSHPVYGVEESRNPAICQPDGAVRVTQSEVVAPTGEPPSGAPTDTPSASASASDSASASA